MQDFLTNWADAALTTAGFFWTAFWAFCLGYVISSAIQVFVTEERMRETIGKAGPKSVGLASFFGFLSSSCSFAALATTRSLLAKGAGLVPALAFLLASTNLVVELGVIIALFLSWQFVVGEYVGGVILILLMWLIVRVTRPARLIERVREKLGADEGGSPEKISDLVKSRRVWEKLSRTYAMEWQMVWKDVTVGFTLAGIIAAFVPAEFFTWLFPGTGQEGDPSFLQVLAQAVIGPVAAFFTFIGSMGNIPLASLLFANGVSVAGIMAFIFSDLIVFPVLRVNASFYGWKMSLYIAGVFFAALVVTAIAIHYGFAITGLAPDSGASQGLPEPSDRFGIDYTFFLNLAFGAVTAVFGWLMWNARGESGGHHHDHGGSSWGEKLLRSLAFLSFAWLAAGLVLRLIVGGN